MTMTPDNDYKNALPLGFQLQEYRIDAVLGAGGFGITYLAQDLHLNKPVVIKEYLPTDLAVREASVTVAPKSTRDQDAYQWGLERFMAEAQTLAQFKHPNIVQVFRYFTAHSTAYIVMDYEQGESLSAYLDRLQRPLNEAEALSIFLPVLDGVRAVHQADFLHRDIKPDNIFLRTNSTPILIDFGAARMALGERSRSLSVVVSAGFAPFEQYSSQGRQGPWTDIYALGATLYRAITGNAPPEATERSMALTEDEPDPYQPLSGRLESQSYSPAFLAAIDRALEFRGKNRPQTVREFQYLLQGKIHQTPKKQPEAERLATEKSKQGIIKPKAKQEELIAGRYRDNGDGTVTDMTTGLQWMRCSLGQVWQNQGCMGKAKKYKYDEAIEAARQTVFAGYRDWRVPTIDELKTLIYCSTDSPKTWNDTGNVCEGKHQKPTIHPDAFPNTTSWVFWSSSPYAYHSNGAWLVHFCNGSVGFNLKTLNYHVRLVRGGQ
ncbi:protein kinase domain-containing protein [Methylotuvimicrobium alcaliphilum]|uniref:Serine/threonine protein kinase (Modular protein) n=1 Tax=Methylotuvimicrobium alcaliphilum (strain DSM 19304 / NCIMB 14124 / VKM B-2133 / 20Z) TaxID=1091494 RepID=G4T482_META2|nr:DUF1566 domain-containing protein [Methylotuvimicrobium alcaliphilum]CCE23798.1 Serine/threonine protein kinase (modular protein) [Methylotuvimicrobium alcaliphilum 20Z]